LKSKYEAKRTAQYKNFFWNNCLNSISWKYSLWKYVFYILYVYDLWTDTYVYINCCICIYYNHISHPRSRSLYIYSYFSESLLRIFVKNSDFLIPISLQPDVKPLILQTINKVRSNNLCFEISKVPFTLVPAFPIQNAYIILCKIFIFNFTIWTFFSEPFKDSNNCKLNANISS